VPSTLEGLLVLVLAVLPGALAVFAFERLAGRYAIGFGDRVLRFIAATAFLQLIMAPLAYLVWFENIRDHPSDEKLSVCVWVAAIAYVAFPMALGAVLGWRYTQGGEWVKYLGANPPTAWDSLFYGRPRGWVLIRLKSGRWIGGLFDESNYAGGYPEPADLLIDEHVVDQSREDFVLDPSTKKPHSLQRGLLVRWDEVEYLEFQED
jgi:uncharacterized protein DUF6338